MNQCNPGFPPYTYIPGGPWPHPVSDPRGHSAGKPHPRPEPIPLLDWSASPAYLRGFALFNAGYYWEAHEAWEALWHAHGRRGPVAELLRGLIKLAAAGVKVRQGQPHGVITHARRAGDCFAAAEAATGQGRQHLAGLDLPALTRLARSIADAPPSSDLPPSAPAAPVFPFRLEPADTHPPGPPGPSPKPGSEVP